MSDNNNNNNNNMNDNNMNDNNMNDNNDNVNNRTLFDNRGRYFDTYKFNKNFDEYIEQTNKQNLINQELKTYDLNKIENITINPYNLTFAEILTNIQSMWFRFYDNLTSGNNILKNSNFNDLFYLAISFISIFLLYIILYSLFT